MKILVSVLKKSNIIKKKYCKKSDCEKSKRENHAMQ